MDLRWHAMPCRALILGRRRICELLCGGEAVDDTKISDLLVLVIGERVVRRVRACELGVPAGVVDLLCAEQRRLLRCLERCSVDVPVEVSLSVRREQRVRL